LLISTCLHRSLLQVLHLLSIPPVTAASLLSTSAGSWFLFPPPIPRHCRHLLPSLLFITLLRLPDFLPSPLIFLLLTSHRYLHVLLLLRLLSTFSSLLHRFLSLPFLSTSHSHTCYPTTLNLHLRTPSNFIKYNTSTQICPFSMEDPRPKRLTLFINKRSQS